MSPGNFTLYYTIISPSTNARVRFLNNTSIMEAKRHIRLRNTLSREKKYALTNLDMAPTMAKARKKSVSFKSLTRIIQDQMDIHGTVDLLFVILSKIPINVTTVYIASNKVKIRHVWPMSISV